MNKKVVLVLFLVLATLAGYQAACMLRAHRDHKPEYCGESGLQWLKQEFHLSDGQFKKIQGLHEAYAPECCAHCCELKAAERQLGTVLNVNTSITPEVDAAMERVDKAAGESRRAVLQHIYSVSREMPPEEGRRYVEMMSRHLSGCTEAGAGGEACH